MLNKKIIFKIGFLMLKLDFKKNFSKLQTSKNSNLVKVSFNFKVLSTPQFGAGVSGLGNQVKRLLIQKPAPDSSSTGVYRKAITPVKLYGERKINPGHLNPSQNHKVSKITRSIKIVPWFRHSQKHYHTPL